MTFDSVEVKAIGRVAQRRLVYALLASLLAHVLIFWPDATRLLSKEAPSVLQATLKTAPPAVSAGVRALPLPPALPRDVLLSTPAVPLRQPVLEPLAPASVPQVASASLVPPSSEIAPPVIATPVRGAGGVSWVTEAGATGEALEGLRSYRLAVATQARRFKRYPAPAMASGWEGVAEIRVEVGSEGRPNIAVTRSSGHESLDRAATAMIDAGTRQARLPESLRGKAFAVVLPVVFSLDER